MAGGAATLPSYATSFVGRDDERARLGELLVSERLVSIVGIGGTGKTRLAVELGATAATVFTDGVVFVDLSNMRDGNAVSSAILAALGEPLRSEEDDSAALIEALRSRKSLLVVDNCEHLLEPVSELCEAIVHRCPFVVILATSRERLGSVSEFAFDLDPLGLPSDTQTLHGSDAVRLFLERAAVARPNFSVSGSDDDALSEVCVRLDGLPLALELAAARVKVLSVEQIAERLADRFALLTKSEGHPRHQTLVKMLDWSYDLLSDDARMTLRRSASFVGGFDIEAAEAVCAGDGLENGRVIDALGELVDGSLLTIEERAGRTRFRSLETIHEYSRTKLESVDDATAVRARHLTWFVDLTEKAATALTGQNTDRTLTRLDADEDNFRAALEWSIATGRGEEAVKIAGALFRYWYMRGRLDEGRRWIDRALAAGTTDDNGRARALNARASLDLARGEFDAARTAYGEALEIRRTIGDTNGILTTVNDLGSLCLHAGDYDAARPYLEEALRLAEELDSAFSQAAALTNLGQLEILTGDVPAARRYLADALPVWRSIGHAEGLTATLLNLGDADARLNDFDEALERYEEAISLARDVGHQPHIAYALQNLAVIERGRGRADRAATLMGAAESVRSAIGLGFGPDEQADAERETVELRTVLGPDGYERVRRIGRSLDIDEAVAYALGEEPKTASADTANIFRREGEFWTIGFGGATIRVRDAKGLGYLATLISAPGRSYHCAELASAASGPPQAVTPEGLVASGPTGAGDVLDPQARDAYRARLVDLRAELDEAEGWNDNVRAEKVRSEMDAIAAELSSAFGLGGRPRKAADAAERVRKAVTNRIRASIAKIRRENEAMGEHLSRSITTGTFCSYEPAEPTSWTS